MKKTVDYKRAGIRNDLNTTLPSSPSAFNKEYFGRVEPAEVVDIILTSDHKDYTGIHDIGKIKVRRIRSDFGKINSTVYAYPLNPYQKTIPALFECVLLVYGPSKFAGVNNSENYFYMGPYNIWGTTNHNASPFLTTEHAMEYDMQQEDSSMNSLAPKVTDDGIDFGDDFNEKQEIPTLQPFYGDSIQGGRWGNWIRFGNTSFKTKNPWSSTGEDGDPITIISNHKFKDNKKIGNIKVEDINLDDNSIYLCSGQKIGLETATENYKAYKTEPTKPKAYSGNQILFNSDRIVFNAKKDDLFLFAKKSVGLFSDKTINISATDSFVVDSAKYYLGVNAKQNMVLGTELKNWLRELINTIKLITVPTGTGPSLPPINNPEFEILANKLEQILSKKAFLE